MCAATAAGLYPTLSDAMQAMGSGMEAEFVPDPDRARRYDTLYERYRRLGAFVEEETMRARRTP